ncbi:hypothetical protein [Hahella ganghwensis]|uniref:hypothetical protein n=1 Tax=Hahella ganghwensis TaxID=286420 RepID=UPI0003720006|nr:hypothetical protein [Hahella ganghwensis]
MITIRQGSGNRIVQRWLDLLNRYATKKILIILTIFYPVFPLVLLPAIIDTGGAPIPDTYFYYSSDTLYQWLSLYTEEARHCYMLGAVTIDVIYPLYYSISLSLLLTYVLNNLQADRGRIEYLKLLPIMPILADFSENLLLSKIFSAWPNQHEFLATMAGIATLTKWSGLAIVFGLILLLALINLWTSRIK